MGGLPALIRDGHDGILFESGEDAELAARLAELLGNPDRACTIGQGYYYSPPLPADEFDMFVRSYRPRPEDRLTLLAVVSSGPLAFLANELGWLSTEFGRQPWLVYNVFRTKAGITTAPGSVQ